MRTHFIRRLYLGVPRYKCDSIWREEKSKIPSETLRLSSYLVRNHEH